MSSLSSALKIITSSILFRNSGAKDFFKAPSITDLACSSACAAFVAVPKPTPPPKSFNWRAPMLEVIIIMVFLKSIFLPKLSVINPSSKICSKILNTSGCAFSISSNKITAYGFLLTFSVNCPPSS